MANFAHLEIEVSVEVLLKKLKTNRAKHLDHAPRRFLPDAFVGWYNGQLEHWEVH